jgi:hypothetical protein
VSRKKEVKERMNTNRSERFWSHNVRVLTQFCSINRRGIRYIEVYFGGIFFNISWYELP